MESILQKILSPDIAISFNKYISITDMTRYPLPLDNINDLEIFEGKICEYGTFRVTLLKN